MNEYLKELAYYLRHLQVDDKNDSINYYREYFEDGGFNSYQDCVKELGTPRYLSRKILVDLSINEDDHVNKNHHVSNVKTTWLII